MIVNAVSALKTHRADHGTPKKDEVNSGEAQISRALDGDMVVVVVVVSLTEFAACRRVGSQHLRVRLLVPLLRNGGAVPQSFASPALVDIHIAFSCLFFHMLTWRSLPAQSIAHLHHEVRCNALPGQVCESVGQDTKCMLCILCLRCLM